MKSRYFLNDIYVFNNETGKYRLNITIEDFLNLYKCWLCWGDAKYQDGDIRCTNCHHAHARMWTAYIDYNDKPLHYLDAWDFISSKVEVSIMYLRKKEWDTLFLETEQLDNNEYQRLYSDLEDRYNKNAKKYN